MKHDSDLPKPTSAPEPIGHNRIKRVIGKPQPVALDELTIWPPAQAEVDDMTEQELADEIDILSASGQRFSVIGRELGDGKVEIVARAFIVEAVRRHNLAHPPDQRTVDVMLYKLDDDQAFRFLAQDVDAGPDWSSLARGRIFLDAVERFGSVEAAAKACHVSKAAVSKNLDVARCLAVVGAKVEVHRDITQRDAAWLMAIVGRKPNGADAPDAARRKAFLSMIADAEIAPAKKLFAALRRSSEPAPRKRKGIDPILHDGVEIGTIVRRKGGPIRIELANAGEVELDALMRLLKKAIASKRQP